MKKRFFILAIAAISIAATCGCGARNQLAPMSAPISAQIRISEDLYTKKAPVASWKPYFTGEKQEWEFSPGQPWSFSKDDGYSTNQEPGLIASESLYSHLIASADYSGCYVNANGYLTVMLAKPSRKRAKEIGELSAAPVWIVAAEYTYNLLNKAEGETRDALTSWLDEHPDVPVAIYASYAAQLENRVVFELHGSGIPQLLGALDLPDYVEFVYTPTIDASLPHDIPHKPLTAWERDGVIIKSARESYPVGAKFLMVTASHNVENKRLYAPHSYLHIEKYANGEWYDICGDFAETQEYLEMFDIPAGEEKTVHMWIITPETLGIGLYRATYRGQVCLATKLTSTGSIPTGSEITRKHPDDNVTFEFTVTFDAEPLPPYEQLR
jgi:hypothetical protein